MYSFHIPTPPEFQFWPTAFGHGWCDLPPFRSDENERVLERIEQLSDGLVVRLVMRGEPGAVRVDATEALTPGQEAEVRAVAARCLRLAEDMGEFYALLRQYPRLAWVEQLGAGRMLTSPTVWEDLVKTLFTTNTVWRATIQMCERFNALGEPYPGGGHAFPTPERVAALSFDDLHAQVRAGYRDAYLHELARRVAEGEIEVESWRGLPSDVLYKRITALKGFGDYAAGNMLKLLGHYDRLATDTVCRDVYKNQINNGVPAASDAEIAAYYAPFGHWGGLVQWMDVAGTWLRQSS